MNIDHLKYIIEVAETGSMNQAAKQLYVSQQNVSKAIKEIEKALDTKIFDRYKTGVELTENGKLVYEFAKSQASKLDTAFKEMRQLYSMKLSGLINIYSMNSGNCIVVPRILSDFCHEYPNIRINLHEGKRDEVLTNLVNGNADIGIITLYDFEEKNVIDNNPKLYFQPLLRGCHCFWVSSQSNYAKKGFITMDEIMKETIYLTNQYDESLFQFFFRKIVDKYPAYSKIPNIHILTQLIANGNGIFPDIVYKGDELMYSYGLDVSKNVCHVPLQQLPDQVKIEMVLPKIYSEQVKFLKYYLEYFFVETLGGDLYERSDVKTIR